MKKNLLLWKTIGKEQGNFEKLLTDEYFLLEQRFQIF
jgi:hypothetical protein